MLVNIKKNIARFIKPRGKISILSELKPGSRILDIGCGNEQAKKIKKILPDCYYVGIDVGYYNNTNSIMADEFHIVDPSDFTDFISKMSDDYDLIISSHNLEHCNDRYGTVSAMCKCIRQNGMIFISTPSEYTVNFPTRVGTLNYFDDDTHVDKPLDHSKVLKLFGKNDVEVIFSTKSYKPILGYMIGFLFEPFSRISKKVKFATWMYWGFEQIFIGRKL